jgi:tetraacyldisaccharide-1-P 4'-kinase
VVAFPDHHPFGSRDLARLAARARRLGAGALVTTEKDAVRLPGPAALPVWALRVGLTLEDGAEAWWSRLEARLRARERA